MKIGLIAMSGLRAQDEELVQLLPSLSLLTLPEEAKEHCTSVVVGEEEALWPQLLLDFEQGSLKPYYIQSPLGSTIIKSSYEPWSRKKFVGSPNQISPLLKMTNCSV